MLKVLLLAQDTFSILNKTENFYFLAVPQSKKSDEKEQSEEPKKPIYQSSFDQLFHTMARSTYKANNKITVVGAGDVGMATVFALLAKVRFRNLSFIATSKDIMITSILVHSFKTDNAIFPSSRVRFV
jgi:hypothetical protein